MSEVWLAEDLELERRVAVKLLAPTADRNRFEREAFAYAACSHSNVACVFDYGEVKGRPYIVLEHLPGGTLEDRLRAQAPLPDSETIRIAREIAAGMAHAHSQGLVHRDLKPANILFDDEGHAKISDFGIARPTDASTLTDAGTILGTAAYASPEQATEQPVTPASDVYSFGVILFRMLTGRLPFTATSPMELLLQHARAEPPRVSSVRGDAPPHLADLTMATLTKDPGARPPDGGALLAALSSPTEAPPDTAATRILPSPRRLPSRRTALGGAAALTILVPVGFAAAVLATNSNSSEPRPAPAGTRQQQPNTSESRPQSTSSSAPTSTSRSTTTTTGRSETQPTSTQQTTPVGQDSPPTTAESTTTTTSTEGTTTEPTGTATTP